MFNNLLIQIESEDNFAKYSFEKQGKQQITEIEEDNPQVISIFINLVENQFFQLVSDAKVEDQSESSSSIKSCNAAFSDSTTIEEDCEEPSFEQCSPQLSSTVEENSSENSDQNSCFHAKNSNLMKNILKSFQRFVENEKDPQEQKKYCQMAQVSYGYSQLCKFLKFSLKSQGKRWNMKAKNIIEKSHMKNLFSFYLENINRFWLDSSKVSNKKDHQKLIGYLLNYIKNPHSCEEIRFYQKKKSIIKRLY